MPIGFKKILTVLWKDFVYGVENLVLRLVSDWMVFGISVNTTKFEVCLRKPLNVHKFRVLTTA